MSIRVKHVVLLAAALAISGGAQAGFLDVDPNAMPAFQGSVLFQDDGALPPYIPGIYSSTLVDYAVYEPRKFSKSFKRFREKGKKQYVYAFQLHNQATNHITQYTVRVDPEDLNNKSKVGSIGPGTSPSSANFVGTSANWTFGSLAKSSDILYFTSPRAPGFDNAAILNSLAIPAAGFVPSPLNPTELNAAQAGPAGASSALMPEPGAALALSAAFLLARAGRRSHREPV